MRNLLATILIATSSIINAQEEKSKNPIGIGFHLNEVQNDFGFGLNVSSPEFMNKTLVLNLRANMMYFQHILDQETTWTPYFNVMIGLTSTPFYINESIGLYGEGGTILILPHSDFSSSDQKWGGYGIFGFEFQFNKSFCYFIELGGVGIGAVADKVAGEPIYSNGFLTTVGFKIKL